MKSPVEGQDHERSRELAVDQSHQEPEVKAWDSKEEAAKDLEEEETAGEALEEEDPLKADATDESWIAWCFDPLAQAGVF